VRDNISPLISELMNDEEISRLGEKIKQLPEPRYNYEDLNTISAWAGYNFTGGKKFEYAITPILGCILGNTRGISAGLEFTLGFDDPYIILSLTFTLPQH
jgi:hypothetical protein